MKNIHIKKINFVSFILIMFFIFFSLGLLSGVAAFINSFFGTVNLNLGFFRYNIEGNKYVILVLFLSPIISSLTGVLYGILLYYPFNFLLQYFKIKVKVNYEEL